MSTYVLVHGGKNTGEIWDKVVPLLKQHGSTVFFPSLPDPYTHTLEDHIKVVCDVLTDQGLDKVILVGHSYAGMVITGVASTLPERLKCLIYVDAAVPESGQSLFDILNATGHDAQTYYGIEPLKPFTDPLLFDDKNLKQIPKAYILCTESEFINVSKSTFDKLTVTPPDENWTTYKIKSHHLVMGEHPKELTDLFLKIEAS